MAASKLHKHRAHVTLLSGPTVHSLYRAMALEVPTSCKMRMLSQDGSASNFTQGRNYTALIGEIFMYSLYSRSVRRISVEISCHYS